MYSQGAEYAQFFQLGFLSLESPVCTKSYDLKSSLIKSENKPEAKNTNSVFKGWWRYTPVAAAIINAFGVSIFLIPVKLYDSGISGVSMLLDQITPVRFTLSLFLIIFNFPIFLFGLKKQGLIFTIYSLFQLSCLPLLQVSQSSLMNLVSIVY